MVQGVGVSITPHLVPRTKLRMAQARTWIFTWNKPSMKPDELIAALEDSKARYASFQLEKGEDTGKEHYQGYVEFSIPRRLSYLKKIDRKIHWEVRRGTRDQARDYTRKDETRIDGPWEFGTWNKNGQGHRSELDELYKLAKQSKTLNEVAEACPGPYMRYYKAVQHVRQINAFDPTPRSQPPQVILIYGPPGTGKTRYAYDTAPDLYALPVGKQLWVDGYSAQKDVLIDDFSGNVRLVDMLRMLDRYPVQVPIKGGHVWWCPERIFITSNVHPSNWYDYSTRKDSYRALTRRFTKVIQTSDDNENKIFEGEDVVDFFNQD